ncbi:unnamed protein product [Linum tenue]
MWPTS